MKTPHFYRDIVEELSRSKDDLVKVVSDIVKIPSINPTYPGISKNAVIGGETQVNEYLKSVMDSFGLATDLWEEEKGRANLVGLHRGKEGRSLIFNGHVDVVPPGPDYLWPDVSPWSGIVKDGRVYGRGSADMKGGLATSIFALKSLLEAGYKPKGDIILEAVSGEEMMETDIGTGATLKRGYRADAAIVVEPSYPPYHLGILLASPGALKMKVTVKGKASHTAMRSELVRAGGRGEAVAVSAIDKALIIYDGLLKLEEEWGQTKIHPSFTLPGRFTICPITILGGLSGVTCIPEECSIQYVIWHRPGETPDQVKREIELQVEAFAQTDSWLRKNPPILEWADFWWPPYVVQRNSPICKVAALAREVVLNEPTQFEGFMAVNDASFLNAAGIPTITLGPGDLKQAHAPNEFVDISDLMNAATAFALIIAEWCGLE
jgi:acetylornithine deacetylase/succinyl-diaminopimelate desuccinylase family protein